MKPNLIKIALLTMAIATFAGCRTIKPAAKQTLSGAESTEITRDMIPSELVRRIQKAQPAFRTANASKMSVYVDFKGRKMDVKATCKMVSDSAIHLSVQPFLGVELFKLEMTPTTLILVDKMNKTFYESNYSIFKNRLGVAVNYDVIQSLISNRLFVPGDKTFLPNNFKWKNDKSGNVLVYRNESLTEEIVVNLALTSIAEILIKSNDKAYTVKAAYSDMNVCDGVIFPRKILIDGNNADTKSSFYFTIESVQFDKPIVMEPTNLGRYTRGDINSFFRK